MKDNFDNDKSNNTEVIIARILGGTATAREYEAINAWLHESEANRELFRQTLNLWNSSAKLTTDQSKVLNRILKRIDRETLRSKFLRVFQKAAAVLVIPLLLASIWLLTGRHSNHQTADTGKVYRSAMAAFGTICTVDLPDGTRVWLNSGSSIRYPERLSGPKREVYLDGEAYFEVKSDETHPFIVHAPGLLVQATGTRFVVLSRSNADSKTVSLAEGKLTVSSLQTAGRQIITLKPNNSLHYSTSTDRFTLSRDDSYKYYAWKDGKMIFRNDALADVANRISLQYNVDISIAGDEIKKYRYRATFGNESLEEVLNLLKLSSPIDYTITSQALQPDGSFSKRKVTIHPLNRVK